VLKLWLDRIVTGADLDMAIELLTEERVASAGL